MFKRTWIIVALSLALGIAMAACGSGDLAEDLTPIPTLPKGEEPALVDALAGGAASAAQGTSESAGGGTDLVAQGEALFNQDCSGCHMAEDGVGPGLTGMADQAAVRVEGQPAEEYLHESIVDPSAFVVDGYQDIMPRDFDDKLSNTELDALVAYIMVAGTEGGAATGETPAAETPAAETPEPAAEATGEATPEGEPVDVALGEALFLETCTGCHKEEDGVGPSLVGIGEAAGTMVEGQTAEEYIYTSIVDPGAHMVEGYQDIMPKTYKEMFSEHELNSMVGYLLSQ